jgi:hypothetical protein
MVPDDLIHEPLERVDVLGPMLRKPVELVAQRRPPDDDGGL